jgi:hypothetical protein
MVARKHANMCSDQYVITNIEPTIALKYTIGVHRAVFANTDQATVGLQYSALSDHGTGANPDTALRDDVRWHSSTDH